MYLTQTIRYIHMLSYSKDGNFQQHQHDKKMDMKDIPLTKGAAYYADEDEYTEFQQCMKDLEADVEVSYSY